MRGSIAPAAPLPTIESMQPCESHMRYRIETIVFVLSLLLWFPSPTAAEEIFKGKTMGPVDYQVTLPSLPPDQSREKIAAAITEALEGVNQRMSTYQPDSEVSRFNRSTTTDWQPVSLDTAQVVQRAIELSVASEGAFDITVAPLVNLWSFGPDGHPETLPEDAEIQTALAKVGYQALEARLDPPALRKSNPELTIDLSAIAKGFAVDAVALRLTALGVQDYLVEVGGEVRTLGKNPRGTSWVLAIEEPIPLMRGVSNYAVPLSGKSLATSGDYRSFFVVDGKTYSHTIDPAAGRPVSHAMHSVSVIADDCMTADAWATALMVVGPDRIREYADRADIDVFWITSKPDENQNRAFEHEWTEGFPLLSEGQPDAKANTFWPMFAAALIVFVVALIGMAIGVIVSNRTIKGSCGGLAALRRGDEKSPCEVCQSRSTCDEYQKAVSKNDNEHDDDFASSDDPNTRKPTYR